MSNKKTFKDLINKYGQDFNWQEIDIQNNPFLNELNSELNEEHPLFKKVENVVARRFSQDDILCLLHNKKYAIIHFTYSKYNINGYPRFTAFEDFQGALSYIEREYIFEFGAE